MGFFFLDSGESQEIITFLKEVDYKNDNFQRILRNCKAISKQFQI